MVILSQDMILYSIIEADFDWRSHMYRRWEGNSVNTTATITNEYVLPRNVDIMTPDINGVQTGIQSTGNHTLIPAI